MEKQNDIFTGDIFLKGKHATYAKFFCPTPEKKDSFSDRKPADIFKRVIDVYMMAAVIGLEHGLRASEDRASADQAHIHADVINREKLNLVFIFQLVMLVDNSQRLDADAKIARAFKNDDIKANFELFNSYVRGGIEWLYERFTEGTTTHDDYISKIQDVVADFKEEYGL